jgi:hypothetical protein
LQQSAGNSIEDFEDGDEDEEGDGVGGEITDGSDNSDRNRSS